MVELTCPNGHNCCYFMSIWLEKRPLNGHFLVKNVVKNNHFNLISHIINYLSTFTAYWTIGNLTKSTENCNHYDHWSLSGDHCRNGCHHVIKRNTVFGRNDHFNQRKYDHFNDDKTTKIASRVRFISAHCEYII